MRILHSRFPLPAAVTTSLCAVVRPVFCLLVPRSPSAQRLAVEGERVTGIRVVDQTGSEVSEKIPPLALQIGKPFDFSDERQSLRDIYRMGDYADIRVNGLPESERQRASGIL